MGIVVLSLIISCNNYRGIEIPPIKDMEYIDTEMFLKGTDFESDTTNRTEKVRLHFYKQSRLWTGFPSDLQRQVNDQTKEKCEIRTTDIIEQFESLVLAEPLALLINGRFAKLNSLPMAETLAEAQTLINVHYNLNHLDNFDIFVYDIQTGFRYPMFSNSLDENDEKTLFSEIERILVNLKHAQWENSTPGRYDKFIRKLIGEEGTENLSTILANDYSGALSLFEVYPDIERKDIRAIIVPREYDYNLTERDNWTLSSPGNLFREDNVTIHYISESLSDDGLIICVYMESISFFGTYTNGAKGFSSKNIVRLIDINTGKTEAIYRTTMNPPHQISTLSVRNIVDRLDYFSIHNLLINKDQ